MFVHTRIHTQLKGTYLVVYGKWPVFAATSLLTVVGMSASYAIDIHGLLWPLQLALIGVSLKWIHVHVRMYNVYAHHNNLIPIRQMKSGGRVLDLCALNVSPDWRIKFEYCIVVVCVCSYVYTCSSVLL